MESAKRKTYYKKIVITDNKLECNSEYKLSNCRIENVSRINNNNLIKDMLYKIQKVQKHTNDELYEFKTKNPINKLLFKNEKNKLCEKENDGFNSKLEQKNRFNNYHYNKNIHYKDVPLTAFFK